MGMHLFVGIYFNWNLSEFIELTIISFKTLDDASNFLDYLSNIHEHFFNMIFHNYDLAQKELNFWVSFSLCDYLDEKCGAIKLHIKA